MGDDLRRGLVAVLDDKLVTIGGCSDGHCVVVRPKGMHTNGGCRCPRDAFKMQRVLYAYQQFRAGVAALTPKEDNHA